MKTFESRFDSKITGRSILFATGILLGMVGLDVIAASASPPIVTTTTTTTLSVTTSTSYTAVHSQSALVAAGPDALLQVGVNIWVASCSSNTVTEINGETGQILRVLDASTYEFNCPDALAFDGSNLWVANRLGNSLTVLNETNYAWVQTLTGSQILNPNALAMDGTNVWVSDDSQNGDVGSFISEFNVATGLAERVITTPKNYRYSFIDPDGLVVVGTDLWVADAINNGAQEFSTTSGAYLGHTKGGEGTNGTSGITYHNGYIWLSGFDTYVVIEYRASNGSYVRTIRNVVNPTQVVFTGHDLFVISESPIDSVREYDSSGRFLKVIAKSGKSLGQGISAFLVDGSTLWTANYSQGSVADYHI